MKIVLFGVLLALSSMVQADVESLKEDYKDFLVLHPQAIEHVVAQNKLYECSYYKRLNELKQDSVTRDCISEIEYVRSFKKSHKRIITERVIYSNIALGVRDANIYVEKELSNKRTQEEPAEVKTTLKSFETLYLYASKQATRLMNK